MKVFCPHCNQKLSCDDKFGGKVIRCPACSEALELPIPDLPPEPPLQEEADSEGRTISQTTSHSGTQRSDLTISQYMRDRKIEGGIDLGGKSGSVSASQVLEADSGKKYNLGDEISRGGMGAILDAKDVNIRRNVAMKVMLDPKQSSEEEIMRFIEEAQVTGQLEHPGIVPVYELGVDTSGNVFYTMKFIAGVTLKEVIMGIADNEPGVEVEFPLPRLLTIFQSICDAMAYSHSKHVIHRDLKPENIMIGEYGEVLVLDWGLAKVLDGTSAPIPNSSNSAFMSMQDIRSSTVSSARREFDTEGTVMQTMVGDVMGTPAFMAPEQAAGDIDDIDQRTDTFALGAILYNILALEAPIQGDNLNEVIMHACEAEIVPMDSYDRDMPESLQAVCLKALAKRQDDRYQNVKGLQQDIAAYQTGFATSAENVTAWKQVQLFVKRNKAVCVTAAALLLLLTVSLSAYTVINIQQRQRAEVALSNLQQTAPTFIELAEEQIAVQKFDQALSNINYAISLVPRNADYHNRKGDILQSALDMLGAAESYEAALHLNGSLPYASINLELCKQVHHANAGRTDLRPKSIKQLSDAMRAQGRLVEVLAISSHLENGVATLSETLKQMLQKAKLDPNRLTVSANGSVALNLSSTDIANLNSLRGMPLTSLSLGRCKKVQDLSPLKGMPLTSLQIHECNEIKDLTPLKDMPLKSLHMWETGVSDLSPLKGVPLEALYMHAQSKPVPPVTDISILRELPLKTLTLAPERIIDGWTDLRSLSSIKTINGEPTRKFWERFDAGEFFAGAEFKEQLEEVWPGSSAQLYKTEGKLLSLSLRGRKDVTTLEPLKGLPLSSLDIHGCRNVNDLSPLKGMQLTSLKMATVQAADLSPLKGMPLKILEIHGCSNIKDLSPLRNAPLKLLHMSGTGVSDISPLANSPLEELYIQWPGQSTAPVTDLTPLKGVPLITLTLTPENIISGLDKLKALKTLKSINGQPPLKFWEQADAGQFYAGTEFKERLEKAWPGSSRGLQKTKGKELSLSLQDRKDVISLEPLRGLPLASLTIQGCTNIKDLAPLKGMQLTYLNMHKAQVSDLSPLKGMPIRSLFIHGCSNIKDLSPLRNAPLRLLHMSGTGVSDISPLANSPLEELYILWPAQSTPPVTDISNIKNMPLEKLTYSPEKTTKGFDVLRNHKTLKSINNDPPKIYWEKHDGGLFYAGEEYREKLEQAWAGSSRHLSKTKGAYLAFSLRGRIDITTLEPLRGIPIAELDIGSCSNVKDLSPLTGMPLRSLAMYRTGVSDLSPLKGMPLETLSIQECGNIKSLAPLQGMKLKTLYMHTCHNVTDIASLRGMPITTLQLYNCSKLTDITPLQGMKLTTLYLYGCNNISDLSPLKGMPLTSLRIHGCKKISDLTPIAGMKLTDLQIYDCSSISNLAPIKSTPLKSLRLTRTGVVDLSPLKGSQVENLSLYVPNQGLAPATDITPLKHVHLKTLSFAPERIIKGFKELRAIKTLTNINGDPPNIFWENYDAGQFFGGAEFKERLEKVWPGSSRGLQKSKGKELSLSLQNRKDVTSLEPLRGLPLANLNIHGCTNIKDLAPLKGMQLTSLKMYNVQVSDLSPLKGMPLTTLEIHHCSNIKDLSPLKGIPLKSLHMYGTKISDLSPLIGSPIESLYLYAVNNPAAPVSDITPLKHLPLKSLSFVPERIIKGVNEVRAIKSLKTINGEPPQIFWEKFDKGQFYAGAEFKKRLEKAWPGSTGNLKKASGMHLTFSLRDRKDVLNLAPLKGIPLSALDIWGCHNIKDVSAIAGMHTLTSLTIQPGTITLIVKPLSGPVAAKDIPKAKSAATALQKKWRNCPAMKKIVDTEIKKLLPDK